MGKWHSRICDWCDEHYEGYGEKYCSPECTGAAKTALSKGIEVPHNADKPVTLERREDGTALAVARSSDIRTIDDLIEAAPIDTEVWDVERWVCNKWEVAGKTPEGRFIKEELWQVKAWLRLKLTSENFLPPPIHIEIPYISRAKYRKERGFCSIHFGDEHIPFHDPRAINLLYQVMEIVDPDIVIAHGDVLDCTEVSDYEKDPFNRIGLNEELRLGAMHLGTVKALSERAERTYFLGNHEDRIRRTIWKLAAGRAAGEILTLPDVRDALDLSSLMGLGDDWDVVTYPQSKVLFDRLIVKHGNLLGPRSGASALKEYSTYGKSGMSGHSHRRGVYEHRDHNGFHAWWEIGLLGMIRHDYVAFADWQQGFAVVRWSDDRTEFAVEEVRIHEGVAYFRGDRYEGDSKTFDELSTP